MDWRSNIEGPRREYLPVVSNEGHSKWVFQIKLLVMESIRHFVVMVTWVMAAALWLPAQTKAPGQASAGSQAGAWVGSWAASQQLPEPQNSLPAEDLNDATLRQIVHLSVGGPALRVHLSNAFGFLPLHLTSVHIARPLSQGAAGIDASTDKALTFSGRKDVIIPAGAEYISDPVDYSARALSNLAVSMHFDLPPAEQSGHPGSRATSYLVHGDAVSAADFAGARKFDHWYQLAAIDVAAAPDAAAIVALGDSITDGHGATTNGNDRWTDVLAQRLQANATTRNIGVLNQGIGGNHLLTDGLGPNVLARFDRDVLAQTGVRWVIVLEGVNDIGGLTRLSDPPRAEHEAFVRRVLASYEQMIARAHAAHIQVIGATILPYTDSNYYHPPASNEADRQTINQWIRAPGHFDAVVDFDKAMADPKRPDHLNPTYDSGDHLHPSVAGYHVMGEAVPLGLFAR
jgi:lysophospholipase L1-like esterase